MSHVDRARDACLEAELLVQRARELIDRAEQRYRRQMGLLGEHAEPQAPTESARDPGR